MSIALLHFVIIASQCNRRLWEEGLGFGLLRFHIIIISMISNPRNFFLILVSAVLYRFKYCYICISIFFTQNANFFQTMAIKTLHCSFFYFHYVIRKWEKQILIRNLLLLLTEDELTLLIISSIHILKRNKKKCGKVEE